MAESLSTNDAVKICDSGRSEIELTFDDPQTILDVTFFDVTKITKFTYIMEDGEEASVTIPAGGFGLPSTEDISGQQSPAPVDVKAIRLHGS